MEISMLLTILISLVLGYLFSKILTKSIERENEALKITIKMLKKKALEQKEKHDERVWLMNEALEQWKRANGS
jgi:uncharacterized membrane protein YraQ (UPF0718 family)